MIPNEKTTISRKDFVRLVGGVAAFLVVKKVAGGAQAAKTVAALKPGNNHAYGGSAYGGKKA